VIPRQRGFWLAAGLLFPAVAHAQAEITEITCFRFVYDSAQHGAAPGLFPARLVLGPGHQQGDARIVDSAFFDHYRQPSGVARWYSRSATIWSFVIESESAGVSFTLRPKGDSLVGWAVYRTDAPRSAEPRMRATGVRIPCTALRPN
jgi:hypothetical protein